MCCSGALCGAVGPWADLLLLLLLCNGADVDVADARGLWARGDGGAAHGAAVQQGVLLLLRVVCLQGKGDCNAVLTVFVC